MTYRQTIRFERAKAAFELERIESMNHWKRLRQAQIDVIKMYDEMLKKNENQGS